MNNIELKKEYLHVLTGTMVRVVNTCTIDKEIMQENGETEIEKEPAVMFVTLDGEAYNETPRVLSTKEFSYNFVPQYLEIGMSVLMTSMGSIIGETEVEKTDDPEVMRLKHAGELVKRRVNPNGTLDVIYLPYSCQAYEYTVREMTSVSAKRKAIVEKMIQTLRSFEEDLDKVGVLEHTSHQLGSAHKVIKNTIETVKKELGLL